MTEQYVSIGFTKKSYGSHGELKASVEDRYLQDFMRSEVIFLNVQNKPLPFFIEKVRAGTDLILKLEDVNSPDEAKRYTSAEMFLRKSDLIEPAGSSDEDDEITFDMLVGFEMFDAERGKLGPILEVQEYTHHDIAVVAFEGREILIPLHEELIESVDLDEKKITLQLPEGLLDL